MNNSEDQVRSEILSQGVYVRVPKVSVGLDHSIETNGEFDRNLLVWYDENDHQRALIQKRTISDYLEHRKPYRFSSGGVLLKKLYRQENLWASLERCREKFGDLKIPIEIAPQIADAFDPDEWVVHRAYVIDIQPERFEEICAPRIGTLVELTQRSFVRYLEHLKKVKSSITKYWGERVSNSELIKFAEQYPKIWSDWSEFFVDDGRDEYTDSKGNRILNSLIGSDSEEELLAKGYQHHVPVDTVEKVACSLIHSDLLRKDLENLHKKRPLKFLLEDEVKRRN